MLKATQGLYEYVRQKKETKETLGPLLSSKDVLLVGDKKNVELLNDYFASDFIGKQ